MFRAGARRYGIACHALSIRRMVGSLPSAPGSFGVHHAGCSPVLERFDIPPELARAPGAFPHALAWLTLPGLGPAPAPSRPTSRGELGGAARP